MKTCHQSLRFASGAWWIFEKRRGQVLQISPAISIRHVPTTAALGQEREEVSTGGCLRRDNRTALGFDSSSQGKCCEVIKGRRRERGAAGGQGCNSLQWVCTYCLVEGHFLIGFQSLSSRVLQLRERKPSSSSVSRNDYKRPVEKNPSHELSRYFM